MPSENEIHNIEGQEGESKYKILRTIQIKIKDGYVLRKVGQAYMVMPTGPRMQDYEGMITLNETGAFLFKQMDKPNVSEEELEKACIAEYGATEEEAKEAVGSFINQCAACGLMETVDIPYDSETGRVLTPEEIEKLQKGELV